MTLSSKKVIKMNSNAGSPVEVEQFRFPSVMQKAVEESEGTESVSAEAIDLGNMGISENRLFAEVDERAGALLTEAGRKAEQILQEAMQEAEAMRAEAMERGYAEGYAQGREEGRETARREYEEEKDAELSSFRAELEEVLCSAGRAKEMALKKYMGELKDCVIAVAEKVVHISLKSGGEVIGRMIVSATEKLKKKEWVKIYLNKEDYDLMLEADVDVIKELSRLSDNIKFVVMEQEDSGNCIIEMPDEIIDASVNTQMDNIRDILDVVRI